MYKHVYEHHTYQDSKHKSWDKTDKSKDISKRKASGKHYSRYNKANHGETFTGSLPGVNVQCLWLCSYHSGICLYGVEEKEFRLIYARCMCVCVCVNA